MADQGRLDLGLSEPDPVPAAPELPPGSRVVRVLPDVAAIERSFDYLVPPAWAEDGRGDRLVVGSRVRIALAGRRVGGWVVEDNVVPPAGVELRSLAKASGLGPSPEVIDLARWASHRWAGRLNGLLGTASPPNVVESLPPRPARPTVPPATDTWAVRALEVQRSVVRLPPGADVLPLAVEAARKGDALILLPTVPAADQLALRLRGEGLPVSLAQREWARSAAGGLVVGSRSAALAPVGDLAAVVVVDEHDETYQEERAPTWHARDMAVERARRAGVPCVLTSPSPSLEALRWGELMVPSLEGERDGWPALDLHDRRDDDPVRSGLLGERLVDILRGSEGDPVVCVLNRRGRSRLLACDSCGGLVCCSEHQAPMIQEDADMLVCPVDGARRPQVCDDCGATRFRNLRAGVARIREELEALAGRPVLEVTGDTDMPDGGLGGHAVYVGTEAVLHRVRSAARVVFLEFDQELLAPRMRASEQAMALLIRAARLVGGRSDGGRIVVQTRMPEHEVLQAVLHADPGRLVEAESARRKLLNLPPWSALARVSGPPAEDFITALGSPDGVDLLGPRDGAWLVRAPGHDRLAEVLAAVERPKGRLRIEVDPPRA
ncbi:MAG: hypothetical protein ISR43_01390 [Acidimicrobiia bacterium]|nr:hypothetical protein [Actinomycetota bacterium]MBL6925864.1 hypothetical protein [Acidimicrobiia bacterium]